MNEMGKSNDASVEKADNDIDSKWVNSTSNELDDEVVINVDNGLNSD